MLSKSEVHANFPASDLGRARKFYSEKLGMSPVEENDEYLTYEAGNGTRFGVYRTEFAGQAGHTLAQWHVGDIEKEVRDLRDKGVVFEEYDLPGLEWKDGIASGEMGRAAWFKDSEGNILCLDQLPTS